MATLEITTSLEKIYTVEGTNKIIDPILEDIDRVLVNELPYLYIRTNDNREIRIPAEMLSKSLIESKKDDRDY